jgi:hypothetical protein
MDVGGQDATEAFEDVGHSDEAREILNGLLIGNLKRQVYTTKVLMLETNDANLTQTGGRPQTQDRLLHRNSSDRTQERRRRPRHRCLRHHPRRRCPRFLRIPVLAEQPEQVLGRQYWGVGCTGGCA